MALLVPDLDRPALLRSPRLAESGLPHAFVTRADGFDFRPEHGRSRHSDQRLREALGCLNRRTIQTHQVHGARVLDAAVLDGSSRGAGGAAPADEAGGRSESGTPVSPRADALIDVAPSGSAPGGLGSAPPRLLQMRMADCGTVLLSDPSGRAVAALHAGWRGTVAGTVAATVRALTQRAGLSPSRLIAAIGPTIPSCRFEVGEEVAQAFERAGLTAAVDRQRGRKPHVDLVAALRRQLEAAGVASDRIDESDEAFWHEPGTVHSHRGDGPDAGRMAAYIGRRA